MGEGVGGLGQARGTAARLRSVLPACRRWVAVAGVAALTSLSAVVALPGAASAQASATLDPQASAQTIVLQAARCPTFGDVPGNLRVDPSLDATGGAFTGWGSAPSGPVTPLAFDAGSACAPVDGIRFRSSASAAGIDLAVGAGGYVAPGAEDGEVTAVLAGSTGRDGTGTLRLSIASLTQTQQRALSAGGLWVSALDLPDRFGNLRCAFDRYNADNLEVLRSAGPTVLACVLYLVGSAAPTPASPSDGVDALNSPAPAPTGTTASTGTTPQPTSPSPTSPSSAVPSMPTGGVGTGDAAPGPVVGGVPAETPVAGPVAGPVADLTSPGRSARPGAAVEATSGSVPRVRIEDADRESALAGWSTLSVAVEVGGVTQGAAAVRPGRVLSPWRAPIRVRYACGDRPSVEVEVSPEKAPGYVATGPAVGALPAETCVIIPLADGLGEEGAGSGSAVITINGTTVRTGTATTVTLGSGRDEVQRVLVSFGADGLAGDEAGGSGAAPPADEVAARAPGVLGVDANGPTNRLTPLAVTSLAVVFLVGLALSVLAARQPL